MTSTLCKSYDALVFGSGLAGLAAARRLALGGSRVALLEKASALGGHLLPFSRGGVQFEIGLHYIADVGASSAFGQACGQLGVQFPFRPLDAAFEELRFGEGGESTHGGLKGTVLYEGSFADFVQSLTLRFPAHVRGLHSYLQVVQTAWELAQSITFPARTSHVVRAALANPRFLKLLPFATLSLREALVKTFRFSEPLVEILAAQHLLMGVAPSELSCLVHFVVHRYYFEGACFVEGGGAEMIRQLTAGPFQTKVDVYVNADATLVRNGISGRFQAQWKHKEESFQVEGKRVVWTPDPRSLQATAPSLFPLLSPLNRLRLRAAKAPHALVVGYFATRSPLEELGFPNRNVWLMGSLNAESCYLNHASEGGVEHLASEAALYVSTGSLRDPHACPPGNALKAQGVFQAMFLCSGEVSVWNVEDYDSYRVPESKGGQGRAYREKKALVLGRLVERLERAFPGVKENLVWKELGTPLTHQRYLNSLTRSGYGYAATVPDFLWSRPSFESGIEGLHFCGAHVKPAHGIVTALVNGVGLAERILSWENGRTSAENGRTRVEGLAATS